MCTIADEKSFEAVIKALLLPTLGSYMQVLGSVLTMKPTKGDKDDNEADSTTGFGFRIEALKTLHLLTESFPKVGLTH